MTAPTVTPPPLQLVLGEEELLVERAETLRTGELGGERDLVATFPARQCARRPKIEGGGGLVLHMHGCHREVSPHLSRGRVGIGTVVVAVLAMRRWLTPVAGASSGRSLCPSG